MTTLTYQQAGVNIDAGNQLVGKIKKTAQLTHSSRVLQGIGGFSALYALPFERYQQPCLVSCTDGVGTKLKLALDTGQLSGIGIDLVAMCANDLICCGAEPLFFLDYYATGQLDVDQAQMVIESIAEGCQQAGLSLIGGETAEMPGLYQNNDFDLAGFCVGIVEREHVIDGHEIKVGDQLIALPSSGCHSNGYSLIRKLLLQEKSPHSIECGGEKLIQKLLQPTQIYVKALQPLIRDRLILAAAHITGGGLLENLPRALPNQLAAAIDVTSWQWPEEFTWLKQAGSIAAQEMYRTFNCGVGMVICVDKQQAELALSYLKQQGQAAWRIGEVIAPQEQRVVFTNV